MMLPSELRKNLGQALDWLWNSEGTGHSLALIRVGIVFNAWARFSNDHVLYRDLTPEVLVVGCLFFLSSTLTFIGLFTEIAKWGFAVSLLYFVYVTGHKYGYEPYTHHHTTLLAVSGLLLALSPCGASLSMDRSLALRRAERNGEEPPSELVPLWSQRLIALQVASIYFWGAYDKCTWGFLSGARMSHYLMYYYSGPTPLADYSSLLTMSMLPSAWATVILEFLLAIGLFFKSARRWLVLPGLLLHGLFYFSLSVFTYTTTMWVLYLAFYDPEEVRAWLARHTRSEAA